MIPTDYPACDFIALLKYRTTEEGGRTTPAFSRYRPHVRFEFDKTMTSGQQIFLDKEIVYPGETVTAAITIIMSEYFENKLSEGISFEFGEGTRVIGTGCITKIVNEKLRHR